MSLCLCFRVFVLVFVCAESFAFVFVSSVCVVDVGCPLRLCLCLWQATTSINELRNAVDTLIVVANDKLLEITDANIPLERAFSVADDILRQVKWTILKHGKKTNVYICPCNYQYVVYVVVGWDAVWCVV